MGRQSWKPGTMVYPVPAAMVTCGDSPENWNIITIAWTGTICTDPAMTYVSIRKSRHSYDLIKNSGEFVINIATEELTKAADLCGVKSGRDINKFEVTNLTPIKGDHVNAPIIKESPVSIECRVTEIKELGSHDMFLAEVLAVNIDDEYMDEKGGFHLNWAKPICYSHGQYHGLTESLGRFGHSVMKESTKRKLNKKKKNIKK